MIKNYEKDEYKEIAIISVSILFHPTTHISQEVDFLILKTLNINGN